MNLTLCPMTMQAPTVHSLIAPRLQLPKPTSSNVITLLQGWDFVSIFNSQVENMPHVLCSTVALTPIHFVCTAFGRRKMFTIAPVIALMLFRLRQENVTETSAANGHSAGSKTLNFLLLMCCFISW